MYFFEKISLAPPDPILSLTAAFHHDPREQKVNLGVGLYKTLELRTPILSSVKSVESVLLDLEKSKEYLPIEGDSRYLELMGALVFGEKLWKEKRSRVAAFQTIGGTGALKMGGTFLREELNSPIWIPTPTWPNHRGIFKSCGLKVEAYPYYDTIHHKLDFEAMMACFEILSPETTVLMHASCQNPTGCDPTIEQWKAVFSLFKARKILPFFDFAYQGLGRGIEEDAEAIRYFMGQEIEMLVAVSNAKNFSLYGERTGCLFVVSHSPKVADHITSRVKQMIRTNYSSPPMHGAKIVAGILGTPLLRQKWEQELKEMRERINILRLELNQRLAEKSGITDFSHLKGGRGMFGFIGLTESQVVRLIKEYAIYLPIDGRINVCGLNAQNLNYVVDAIVSVISSDTQIT